MRGESGMFVSSDAAPVRSGPLPPVGKIVLAFAIVYLGYGLNFLAVKVGVETLPPFLFAGSHIFLAGVIIMGWIVVRRQPAALSASGFRRAMVSSFFLFVGGVGLVTAGEKLGVASGMAAIIKASVPLWVAVFESIRPGGERVNTRMVFGLLLGAGGVAVMVAPQLDFSARNAHPLGTGLLVLSAVLFAIGTIFVRHHPPSESVTTGVAWQMVVGGVYLLVTGLAMGELSSISVSDFTRPVITAFFFLLFVHSIAAFSALNWLLRHLPAALVTTKFYVSPAVAVTAGWLVLGESVTVRTFASMAMILAGVGIILWGGARRHEPPLRPDDPGELED
ncbi:MAG: hypothetical protein D4R65_12545 [Verrucomicrobiaceae bacterium]|nr:MAG: hypothetical protein D4R65_12545 [Verrucomicrobiaceae bacterium]